MEVRVLFGACEKARTEGLLRKARFKRALLVLGSVASRSASGPVSAGSGVVVVPAPAFHGASLVGDRFHAHEGGGGEPLMMQSVQSAVKRTSRGAFGGASIESKKVLSAILRSRTSRNSKPPWASIAAVSRR